MARRLWRIGAWRYALIGAAWLPVAVVIDGVVFSVYPGLSNQRAREEFGE